MRGEARFGQHVGHRLVRETKPGMGMDIAQFLPPVGGKIDDRDAPTGARHPGGLVQRAFGVLRAARHGQSGGLVKADAAGAQGGQRRQPAQRRRGRLSAEPRSVKMK